MNNIDIDFKNLSPVLWSILVWGIMYFIIQALTGDIMNYAFNSLVESGNIIIDILYGQLTPEMAEEWGVNSMIATWKFTIDILVSFIIGGLPTAWISYHRKSNKPYGF